MRVQRFENTFRTWSLAWVIACSLLMIESGRLCGVEGARPNVLFIAVDDLRPELACYGESHIHSPNIDQLAATGRIFEYAYCQQAVCNPSRTSLMTGMRPDSIGVTGNHSHFRANRPQTVTLPEHFKNHGYHSAAIGKIYHGVFPDGSSKTTWDTIGDPQSWSVPAIRFGPRYYYTEEGVAAAKQIYERVYQPLNPGPNDWTTKLVFGPATEAPNVSDNTLYDGKVADAAIEALQELKRDEEPFFLAVGFIKPHSPYIAPKKYFDLYRNVDLPMHRGFPVGAPGLAGHNSGELRRYTDQPKSGVITDENQRRVRQAYFACVSFIDAQIGRVLEALERNDLSDNTIVVLYGDHGYHLGEQGLWGKTTNFELDTRVPLIIRVPGMKAAGESSGSLVELIDLYPTLAELAGLPILYQLEGTSLVSIIDDPAQVRKTAAFSQYPRAGGLMGYSMRTKTHRLTQWIHLPSDEIRATELYDYRDGSVESTNIANESPLIVEALSSELQSYAGLQRERELMTLTEPSRVGGGTDSVGFEHFPAGRFDELDTSIGKWTPRTGVSLVDDKHSKTGVQCLQLSGGQETSVVLEIAEDVDMNGDLSFWAERWTKRQPFSFRIEKSQGDGWVEIFNGGMSVQVGRAFLSHVKLPLRDESIRQLRFTVSSPPNTGILLDDVRIAPAVPQELVSVEVLPLTIPALVGTESSPLLKLKIVTKGSLNPIRLTELQGLLLTEGDDVESVQVCLTRASSSFTARTGFGQIYDHRPDEIGLKIKSGSQSEGMETSKFQFSGQESLLEGANYVWLACKLSREADINNRVGAACTELSFSNGEKSKLDMARSIQRMGVAVRKAGDDGVHTYRIPGLATTNKGTLIGVYDIRRRSGGDLPGDIDVGLSRSTDSGRTWDSMKVIMDKGEDPEWRYDGIGDPAVLVDKNTGTIWVAATWSHGNRSWHGSGPGMKPEETGQLMLVRSDDDGLSWSKPINITSQVKKSEWSFILQGPGKGITMLDGTIVFAAQYQDSPEQKRLPRSTIIYSKDHGKTWEVGSGAFDDTTEAQVVEIEPGVLMLNCRYNRGSVRVVMTTRDMGKTWQKHATSERSLIEPVSCMASLIDVDRELGMDRGGWLLFSNPDSSRGRHHITIKASPDRGLTWPKEHRLLLDEGNGSGYSCLSMIDSETVGVLYEGSQSHMTFQSIPLSDLIGNVDDSAGSESSRDERGVSVARIFGDHMVLQSGIEIPVWGWGKVGMEVSVAIGNEIQYAVSNQEGKWSVRFSARRATDIAHAMTIKTDDERIHFKDILFGEVWVCAGQSNMEWPLKKTQGGAAELRHLKDSAGRMGHSKSAVPMRLLHLSGEARGGVGAYTPQVLDRLTPGTYFEGKWKTLSAESVREFSAVAWYFGRLLSKELNVPVGLICLAVGGTPTEAWISREALKLDPDLNGLLAGNWLDNSRLGIFCRTRGEENLIAAIQAGERIPGDELGPNHPFKPGFMWSVGIKPLIGYGIRGVIWYQGESNAETPSRVREHGRMFPLMIKQWRQHWGQGDFPFLYVQLPSLNRPEWPRFRDGQRRALHQLENLGMAVTIDTGHPTNVHPALKKPAGQRLAKWALGTTYQLASYATYSGPLFDGAQSYGGSILVSFTQVGAGLKAADERPVRHFDVCGSDGVFHSAVAKIVGRNTLFVSSASVPDPRDVRYGWYPYPEPEVNLINSAGLPASPFSTLSEEAN